METIVGGGSFASEFGEPALEAELFGPFPVRKDAQGRIYFADAIHFRIFRIETDGGLETVVGTGKYGYSNASGPGTQIALGMLLSFEIGPDGALYWLEAARDSSYVRIRRLVPGGAVETVAGDRAIGFTGDGGPAIDAGLYGSSRIAIGPDSSIYVAAERIHRVRKITPDGTIDTIAGATPVGPRQGGFSGDGGPATEAELNRPHQIRVGPDSTVYVRENAAPNRIVKIRPDGILETYMLAQFAGSTPPDGSARSATLRVDAHTIEIDAEGRLYWRSNQGIRRVASNDTLETVWQGDPSIVGALSVTPDGDLYGTVRSQVFRLLAGGEREPVAGRPRRQHTFGGARASLEIAIYPDRISAGPNGSIYIEDLLTGRVCVARGGRVEVLAGNGVTATADDDREGVNAAMAPLGRVDDVAAAPDGAVYVAEAIRSAGTIWRVGADGTLSRVAGTPGVECRTSEGSCGDGGPAIDALLGRIFDLEVDLDGKVWMLSRQSGASGSEWVVRVIDENSVISTVPIPTHLFQPSRIFFGAQGRVHLANFFRSETFRLEEDGSLTRDPIETPIPIFSGLWVVDSDGNFYASHLGSIVRITPEGVLNAIAPQATGSSTIGVSDLAIDAGDNLYIADTNNWIVRRIANVTACPSPIKPLLAAPAQHATSNSVDIAPRTIVSLYGFGLGPEAPIGAAPDSSGFFPTELAGVRVRVGGVPVPLLFVSAGQTNAVIPSREALGPSLYPAIHSGTVQPLDSTLIAVERSGVVSDPWVLGLSPSAPGLFQQPEGQAAALNQDGSINSAANPAAPGSVVSLFGTGEGAVEPGIPDGRIVLGRPLPQPTLPVAVTIGGQPADVVYAGGAPGLVSGVFQVNVRVPEDALPEGVGSAALRVLLRVGPSDNLATQRVNVIVGE